MKKYDINSIYTTNNNIKITVTQSGSKAMIREKNQDKATLRQGFRVMADNDTLICGDWNMSERDLLLDALRYERYSNLAYKELYFDLIEKLASIGLVQNLEEAE